MSKIKQLFEASEAMFATTELLYEAADSFDELIESLKDLDYPLSLQMKVLQAQAKRFAGKVKQIRKDFVGKVVSDVQD